MVLGVVHGLTNGVRKLDFGLLFVMINLFTFFEFPWNLAGMDHPFPTDSPISIPHDQIIPDTNWIDYEQKRFKKEARENEFPWIVYLRIVRLHNVTNEEQYSVCGGTIIHESWVLTAAHCVSIKDEGFAIAKVYIVAGAHNVSNLGSGTEQIRLHKTIILHGNYSGKADENDIALIELEIPLTFNDAVNRVALVQQMDYRAIDHFIGAGWGEVSKGVLPNVLMKARFDFLVYDDSVTLFTPRIFGQGDSGTPLICYFMGDPSRTPYAIGFLTSIKLIKVLAAQTQMEMTVNLVPRISSFIPWIQFHTRNVDLKEVTPIPSAQMIHNDPNPKPKPQRTNYYGIIANFCGLWLLFSFANDMAGQFELLNQVLL